MGSVLVAVPPNSALENGRSQAVALLPCSRHSTRTLGCSRNTDARAVLLMNQWRQG